LLARAGSLSPAEINGVFAESIVEVEIAAGHALDWPPIMAAFATKRSLCVTLGLAALALAACNTQPKKTARAPKIANGPLPPAVPAAAALPQTTEVTFPSEGHTLYGLVSKPATGSGPFPVMIFNHGSEKNPNPFRTMRTFFTSKGFVFFVPYRTGHGKSGGQNITDQAKASGNKNSAIVPLLEHEVEDVGAACRYIAAQPFVNRSKIIVGGASFGGIETIFAAERGFEFKAAIDWGGDSESWKNTQLRRRLLKAVDRAKIPIFFLQAENDHTTEPTRVFGAEAAKMGKPHKAKVYPTFGDPNNPHDGHATFVIKGATVWGNDVIAFINQYAK
jgi:dienelactone hydrolase